MSFMAGSESVVKYRHFLPSPPRIASSDALPVLSRCWGARVAVGAMQIPESSLQRSPTSVAEF